MQALLGTPARQGSGISPQSLGKSRQSRRRLAACAAAQPEGDHKDAAGTDKRGWQSAALAAALAAPFLAVPGSQAMEAAAPAPVAPAGLPSYPASVKQLLKELRSQSDRLQEANWELEATQRLLYKSQEQLLAKQREMAEVRKSQPSMFSVALATGVAATGAFSGVQAFLHSGLRKVDLERRRAEAGVGAEVKSKLQNEFEGEIERRVGEERAKEAATVVAIIEAEKAARASAEGRAEALQERSAELQTSLDQVAASLAQVREAKQEAETQLALARIEWEAKARAADEVRKAHEDATQTQRNDSLTVMQQLMAERSRNDALQAQLELAVAAAAQAAEASAASQAALDQLSADQARGSELAGRVQELAEQQEAAAARFREAQQQLELERTRNASLQERVEALNSVASQQPLGAAQDEAAAAAQLRDANQKYLEALEELHQERGQVAELQLKLQAKQEELTRIVDDVARLRQRSNVELARLRGAFSGGALGGSVQVEALKSGLGSLQRQAEAAAGAAREQLEQRQQELAEAAALSEDSMPVGWGSPLPSDEANGTGPQLAAGSATEEQQREEQGQPWRPFRMPLRGALDRHSGEKVQLNGQGLAEEHSNGHHANGLHNGHADGDAQPSQHNGSNGFAAEDAEVLQRNTGGPQGQWEPRGEQSVEQAQQGQQLAEHPAWVQETAAAIPQPPQELDGRRVVREWTDPLFTTQTLDAFPDKAVADVEEARCLLERGGYTLLDVRPELEVDVVGRVRGCVNVPLHHSRWVHTSQARAKQVERSENPDFVAQVEQQFPNKDAPLVVGCSDGRAYSIDALEALEDAGYTRLVGLRGGFHAWFNVFDAKGRRRRSSGGKLARA